MVNPNSLPINYDEQAAYHASQGCYVLAVAAKRLLEDEIVDINSMSRDQLEAGAEFIGFMLFRNELKTDTKDALSQLRKGGCRLVMITGDNANTAVYIARESGMIPVSQHSNQPPALVLLGDVAKREKSDGEAVYWKNLEDGSMVGWDILEQLLMLSNSGGRPLELAVTGRAFNSMLEDGNMRRLLLGKDVSVAIRTYFLIRMLSL